MRRGKTYKSGDDPKTNGGVAVLEVGLGTCASTLNASNGVVQIQSGQYVALAREREELPNLELLQATLESLKGVQTVELRIKNRVSRISQNEVERTTENLKSGVQFVLLEGELTENAVNSLRENKYAVKIEQCLVANAQSEEKLPDANLLYALYAALLDIPLKNIAILTKKDDE